MGWKSGPHEVSLMTNSMPNLEFTQPGDPFLDYCLWDYTSPADCKNKLRSVNLLNHSFAIAGCASEILQLCSALRESLGDWRTVWSVKNIQGRLSWELYFYDYKRLSREVSITRTLEVFQRFTNCNLDINEDCLYFMFSIDVDNDLVTGKRNLEGINVYLGDISEHVSAGICYLLSSGGLRMDNLYHFFDARSEMEQITDKVVSSLHLTLSNFDIKTILIPAFSDCQTIVVANKKYNDGIYFSRIDINQFITFLDMMQYPFELQRFIRDNRTRLDHLLFDVGIDYRMEEGRIRYLKSSYYGIF